MTSGPRSFPSLGVLAKSTTSAVVLGGVMYFAYQVYLEWKEEHNSHKKQGKRTPSKYPSKPPSDVDGLILERFESSVKHMKTELGNVPQTSQLEFYALYKQATLGEADEYFGPSGKEPVPPAYNIVARAKYMAWKELAGMSRNAAMQQYIDKAVHYEFTRSIMITGTDSDELGLEEEDGGVMDFAGMGMRQSTLAGVEEEKGASAASEAHPLHEAARTNNIAELRKLLQEKGADANAVDESGQTALHLAADAGHHQCIQILAKNGANVQAADNDGISVLQAAVIGGDVEACRLLCLLGANPDQPDSDGDTPRDCAHDDPLLSEILFQASMGELQVDPDFLLDGTEDAEGTPTSN
eukprot:Nitzschia sp. Nitz4//scaffold269_size25945//15015//16076//NITZ4_008290-RA/size25945-processed-gene-0.14-mRNA-1//-1//CDS//3329544970//7455//frame0